MSKTIQQKILFKNTAANDLYDLYMNQKKHTAVIGGEVKISEKEGTRSPLMVITATGKIST